MTVYVRMHFFGYILGIYLSREKAERELEDGNTIEEWKVV